MCERESTQGQPCHGTKRAAQTSPATSGSRHARAMRLRARGIDRCKLANALHEEDRFLLVDRLEDDVGPWASPDPWRSEHVDRPLVVGPAIDEDPEVRPVVRLEQIRG